MVGAKGGAWEGRVMGREGNKTRCVAKQIEKDRGRLLEQISFVKSAISASAVGLFAAVEILIETKGGGGVGSLEFSASVKQRLGDIAEHFRHSIVLLGRCNESPEDPRRVTGLK